MMRKDSRTAPRPHTRRSRGRGRVQSSASVLQGRRAVLLHARRRASARVARRATVACAFVLIALVPLTASAMSRAPFAPWSWWQGFADLDWATNSSSSDITARTLAPGPSASASSRLIRGNTTRSRTVPNTTPVRLPGAANLTVSPTSAAIAEPAPPPPPVRCTGYVATSGVDTNPGTSAAPFRTISHAEAAAQPGDVVCLRAGVYSEKVQLTRSGAPSAPITVSAAPNETALIDGTNISIDRPD